MKNNINLWIHTGIIEYSKWQLSIIKKSFKNVVPPIKGDLTAGKLKWRGIKIYYDGKRFMWVTQRGKKISLRMILKKSYTKRDKFTFNYGASISWSKLQNRMKV